MLFNLTIKNIDRIFLWLSEPSGLTICFVFSITNLKLLKRIY